MRGSAVVSCGLVAAAFVLACRPASPASEEAGPQWSKPIVAARGNQFDAAVGPDGSIHIIADEYVHYAPDGRKVDSSTEVAAGRRGNLDFAPAIAVDAEGAVHVVTRHDGSYNEGHQIRYRRRASPGCWDLDVEVGRPKARNYVVGVVAMSKGRVFVAYAWAVPGRDMVSHIDFYEIAEGAAKPVGTLEGKFHRADDRFRIRAVGPHYLHLVAGNPWPNGRVHYFVGVPMPGAEVPKAKHTFTSGEYRKGEPCLYADALGTAHLTYGSKHKVWYNRLSADGRKFFPRDAQLADGLGDWHLGIGMSAVAGTDDGKGVLAVMLRTTGEKTASGSEIVWCYSVDGGARWTPAKPTGFITSGGEGRKVPVLLAVKNRVCLFYSSDRQVHFSHVTLPTGNGCPKQKRASGRSQKAGGSAAKPASAPSLNDEQRERLAAWGKEARALVRRRIVAAVGSGRRLSVSGALAGPTGRGTVKRADDRGMVVRSRGVEMTVPWERVRPRDLFQLGMKASRAGDETLDALAFGVEAGLKGDVSRALRESNALHGASAEKLELLRLAVGLGASR